MKNKPILLVAGEPDSVFIELFLKSLKWKRKDFCGQNIIVYVKSDFIVSSGGNI